MGIHSMVEHGEAEPAQASCFQLKSHCLLDLAVLQPLESTGHQEPWTQVGLNQEIDLILLATTKNKKLVEQFRNTSVSLAKKILMLELQREPLLDA